MKKLLIILIGLILYSCGGKIESIGDKTINVFENESVNFNPDEYTDGLKIVSEDFEKMENGRILLKKIKIPDYKRNFNIKVKITLSSNGDRWDKAGSLFIIPKSAESNIKTVFEKKDSLPIAIERTGNLIGTTIQDNYQPVIELLRFMTPFGVGFYSEGMDLRKPVYIPKWADNVLWEEDISDLIGEFQGEVWIGLWIDTWTKEGYKASVALDFSESEFECAARKNMTAMPVINAVNYIGGQEYADFSNISPEAEIEIPRGAKNVKLKYITTGHGGHSGGDEFTKQKNIIELDGKEILNFIPWRDDCASFRRFNPHSGVWLQKDTAQYIDTVRWKYAEKIIEERIASSDFSRSNWCPGSQVSPIEIPLGNINPGKHKIKFSVPDAQPMTENEMNFWLISAYLVWEKE